MVTTFIDDMRDCFKAAGYMRETEGRESGGGFLVATRGHLYGVYSDLQCTESRRGFDALGAGEDFALGAIRALEDVEMTTEERVRAALETAEELCTSVVGPFKIVSKGY